MFRNITARIFLYVILSTIINPGYSWAVNVAMKPNILLILTDDQGYGDLSRHGNPDIKTPHLDQIAEAGAYCEHFYVSPVCSPTRASILTGRYHLRTGVHDVTRGHETMRVEEVTIAEILQSNGYKTSAFGKWHNGAHYPEHPLGQGFDHFTGFCAGHWNNYFDSLIEHDGKPYQTQGFLIDVLTDHAIDFIRQEKSAPWFAYVAYNTPHTPWQVPDKFYQKDHLQGLIPETKCAYAMVENIDFNVGRILATLKEQNIEEQTIVLFLTDNGANSDRYNAGMRGRKASAHEGGSRVPLFIKYPAKIKPGIVVKGLSMHIDLLPTLVELTESKMLSVKPLDGISFATQLTSSDNVIPERKLFTEWGQLNGKSSGKGAVRTNQYRAVKEGKKDWMLFDIQQDPGEEHNLAETHPEILASFKQDFNDWFKDVTQDGFEPIPIQIGHADFPQVTLPAHEAVLTPGKNQGVKYQGERGFANDWITHWTDPAAFVAWPVKFNSPGTYELLLEYGCSQIDAGSILQITLGKLELITPPLPAFVATDLPNHDRIHRKEVTEKIWGKVSVGEVNIKKPYTGELKLTINKLTGLEAPEIKSITLIRK